MEHSLPRTSLLAWPLCVTVLACGESASPDAPSSAPGAGGVGSSGDSGGTQPSSGGSGLSGTDMGGTASGGTAAPGGAGGGTTGGTAGAFPGAGGSDAGSNATGGASLGGSPGSGGRAEGGIPGIDTFSRVTFRVRLYNLTETTGECDSGWPEFDDAVWSSWSFERATNMFTWEDCKGSPGMWESSARVLSDVEAQGIVNSLTLIALSTQGGCTSDTSGGELEIEADGTTAVYRPDTGWCGSGPNDENYVSGAYPLWSWLETLSDSFMIPQAPETLTLHTGDIPTGPFPNAECSKNPFPIEYELDVPSGTLSWRGMSSDPDAGGVITFCPTETRVLEPQELEAVLSAYRMLTLGASAPCHLLERPLSLDQPNGRVSWMEIGPDELIDEVASCYQGSSYPFAIGVADLTRLVADLTE